MSDLSIQSCSGFSLAKENGQICRDEFMHLSVSSGNRRQHTPSIFGRFFMVPEKCEVF